MREKVRDSPSLLMRGVKIVSDSPISRSAALEDVPNAETLAAMKEAESGHDAGVVRVDSLESFMASLEDNPEDTSPEVILSKVE